MRPLKPMLEAARRRNRKRMSDLKPPGEPYAGKLARTVLRERGGGDVALLPGA